MGGTITLILFAFVGAFGDGNSVSLDHVSGFQSFAACEDAGRAAQGMAKGTVKEIKYVCVETGR